MNPSNKLAIAIAAVSALFCIVLYHHMKMKSRLRSLMDQDKLCDTVANCKKKETFEMSKDTAMKTCIQALDTARACLRSSANPMQCYDLIVQGENCLKKSLLESHARSSAASSAKFASAIAHAMSKRKAVSVHDMFPDVSKEDVKMCADLMASVHKMYDDPVAPRVPKHHQMVHPQAVPMHPQALPLPMHAQMSAERPVHGVIAGSDFIELM